MKLENTILVVLSTIMFFACNESKQPVSSNSSLQCNIEGMTCAEGCAKAIQEKVAELNGVASSSVNFEKKLALFTFDSTKTSAAEIIQTIQTLNEGQYKVIPSVSGSEPAVEKNATDEEAIEVQKKEGEANS